MCPFSPAATMTLPTVMIMLLVTISNAVVIAFAFTFGGGGCYRDGHRLRRWNRGFDIDRFNEKSFLLDRTIVPTRIFNAVSNGYGNGMDQIRLMESDMLVCVDSKDIPCGKMSKKEAHSFNQATPRGCAHRAFSVFLFNGDGKLLLTQRAASKITFPSVWTNTCCSHPLYGQALDEVDQPDDFPHFPGIKHAAIRKLYHELGIPPEDVPHEDFRFLTRYHYWAADTVTYGEGTPWGEHEIDYILFFQCAGEGPRVTANHEEVSNFKYVSVKELKHMMYSDEHKGLLWSPWFRGIMENGGFLFWENLEEALRPGSCFCSSDIVYFDPPKEHFASYNLSMHGRETGVVTAEPIAH
mmetsp:Transcript_10905/g.16316  ORF Transcript_10905/g.16316 Transcript_10905/m.16316 type:complete len:353 (+) Transcript_10905:129-1187(+)